MTLHRLLPLVLAALLGLGACGGKDDAATACVALEDSGSEEYDELPDGGAPLRQLLPQVIRVASEDVTFGAIRGLASDDVYAVGSDGLWHWDGCRWSRVAEGEFQELWAVMDTVWVAGHEPGDCSSFTPCHGFLARVRGDELEQVELPEDTGPLHSVWVSESGAIWVAGLRRTTSDLGKFHEVWHWNGESWRGVLLGGCPGGLPFAVVGRSDEEVYLSALSANPSSYCENYRFENVRLWNGEEISLVHDGPCRSRFTGAVDAGSLWLGYCRIDPDGNVTTVDSRMDWGTSDEDTWGARDQSVVRSNGLGELEIEVDVEGSLYRAWGASATDVWVTGDQGMMVHFAP